MSEAQVIEKLTKFKEVLSQYKEENKNLKQQVVDLSEENKKLKEQYESIAEMTKDEASDLRKDIETFQSILKEKEGLLETRTKDYENALSQIDLLKAENETLKAGSIDGDKITQLTADVEKIVSSNVLSEAEKRYEELTKQNTEIETKKYRFGRTSEAVMEQFKSFIEALFNGAQKVDDVWQLRDFEDAMQLAGADLHMSEVFLNRVESVKYKGKKLIFRNPVNVLVSPFDKEFVIKYLCEEE